MPIEFRAAAEGYYKKIEDNTVPLRFAAFRIAECIAGSKAIGSIDNFWPIPKEKNVDDGEPMTKERIEAIFKRHNIKVK